MSYKTKVCQVCGKEYQPTSSNQKYCADCRLVANAEAKKVWNAKWRRAYPEKKKQMGAKWQRENPEKVRVATAKYRKENPEKARAVIAKWCKANPEKMAVKSCKRRLLGFTFLNSWFAGCEGHHVDNEQVINLPKKLHQSIGHNQHPGQGMAQINAIAYNFLFKQEVEAAIKGA